MSIQIKGHSVKMTSLMGRKVFVLFGGEGRWYPGEIVGWRFSPFNHSLKELLVYTHEAAREGWGLGYKAVNQKLVHGSAVLGPCGHKWVSEESHEQFWFLVEEFSKQSSDEDQEIIAAALELRRSQGL